MSDDDENEHCIYGTALPELPKDVIPTKKPITVADQIAVDANGKRRFHGAFTGGFSAGYWNTVGSQAGWTPKEFKSSRSEKANRVAQNASDFMDDEDCGEFGINPQRIQTTNDFTHSATVAGTAGAGGGGGGGASIAGNPVLNMFLMPAKEKACVALLKRMGWRENQDGRFSKSPRKRSQQQQRQPAAKVYQCSMGPMEASLPARADDGDDDDDDAVNNAASDSDESVISVTFNADDFDALAHAPKTNRFGLGYRGLLSDQSTALSTDAGGRVIAVPPPQQQHINLFAPAFEVVDRKHQKKLSIRGQAFGVGAFEEDDDDIYALDDMSRYNFEATKRNGSGTDRRAIEAAPVKYAQTIEGFMPADKRAAAAAKTVYTVPMPRDFRPRNWLQRKSRFEPPVVAPREAQQQQQQKQGMGRHMLTPDERGQLLGDKTAAARIPPPGAAPAPNNSTAAGAPVGPSAAQKILESFDSRFVSVSAEAPPANARTGLQPKRADPVQQKLDALFSKNFVSAGVVADDDDAPKPTATVGELPKTDDTVAAAAVVVEMKRDIVTWQPCPLLYQLMNVEDPSSRGAAGKNSTQAAPFSLLKHVYPQRRSRATEKEFTSAAAAASGDEPEALKNAYVARNADAAPGLPPAAAAAALFSASTTTASAIAAIPLPPPPTLQPVVRPKIAPKTELEQSISKTAAAHPAEKKDIFKAIFESSDEEDDADAAEQPPSESARSTSDASAQLMANLLATKNILRNTSPPRGIFSALPKLQQQQQQQQPSAVKERNDATDAQPPAVAELLPDAYGPSLPARAAAASSSSSHAIETSRKRSHNSSDSSSSDSEAEWIVATPSATSEAHRRGSASRKDSADRSKHRSKHKKHKDHKHKRSKTKKCKKQKKHKK